MPIQPKITRARFVLGPFSAEQMQTIGSAVLDSIAARIRAGLNVNDSPAKRLSFDKKGAYGRRKVRKGLQAVRDWTWTGNTMRALAVKSVSENRVVIGFSDPKSDMIAHVNNRREKQFGVSPKDRGVLTRVVLAVLRQVNAIRVRKAA